MQTRQALSIFGPTASGKSALALALAQRLNGEIVNADSRQVYRHVQRVTAAPTARERALVPHHLFDFLHPADVYSAGRWVAEASLIIEEIFARGRVPIVVGGTGFYLKALMDGLDGVPPVPTEVTAGVAALARDKVWRELQAADPVLASVIVQRGETLNTQRLVRGLAVWRHTGMPLSTWQARPGAARVQAQWLRVGINPPRDILAERICMRWRVLTGRGEEGGVLEEMRALRGLALPEAAPGLQGLAVPVFQAYLDGKMTLAEALDSATRRDLQYAKRQRTWLRTQYRADVMLEAGDADAVETALRS